MTYNSFVGLRGVKKQIILSKENAEKVREMLSNENIPADTWINIQGTGFRKSEIKYVEVNPDGTSAESNDKERDTFYDEEKKKRDTLVNQTPEYKANLLDMFTYLYKFSTGDMPSAEKLSEARAIQLRFFTQHKTRTLCDAHLLKTIIPIVPGKMINVWEKGYFRMVEAALIRDIQLS